MTDQTNTTTEAANDEHVEGRTLYDVLKDAGHSDHDIQGHMFACACTMTLLRGLGLPPQIGIPMVARVTSEKLGIDRDTALLVMAAVIKALRADPEFKAGVEKAVRDHADDFMTGLVNRAENPA